jgi:hemoglobin-like flavoprotein
MLTPRQRAVVRDTWAQVAPTAPAAAALFYGRLFEQAPALRGLFAHADMGAQYQKLTQMLGAAVAHLDRLDDLAPAVEGLGRRHAGYGVRDADYAAVGAALLWTLERGLGDAFTPEARAAWTTTYELLAGIMRSATAGAVVAPAAPLAGRGTTSTQPA